MIIRKTGFNFQKKTSGERSVYTQTTSKVGNMPRRRLEFSQALPTPKQRNLKSLAMQARQNSMAARRRQRPMFEVVWVYASSKVA